MPILNKRLKKRELITSRTYAHTHVYTAESLCSAPETNTTLQISYSSIKKKILRRRKEMMCVYFLWLLWQMITNGMALNCRNWSSHSSGSQKSKVKVSSGAMAPPRPLRTSALSLQLLGAAGIPWPVATLLQPLPLWSHGAFTWPSLVFSSSYKDTCH